MPEQAFPSTPLGAIASDIKDGTHGTHPRVESGIPFLSAKNVTKSGRLCWDEGDDVISEAEYRLITSSFSPKTGDLLVTVVGSLGRTAIFDGSQVAFQRSVAFVRPNEKVLTDYLYQASTDKNFLHQMELRSNSTAQAGLYLGELAKVEIPLPGKKVQQRIAEILSTVDKTIEQTEALIAKTQQIKTGLMHDLFTRGVTSDGQLRPPREEAPQLYKESPLGWIPKEWEFLNVSEIARVIDSLHRTPEFVGIGYPMVRVTDIKGGELDLSQCAQVSRSIFQEFAAPHRPSRGDIVLSRVGTYGVASFVNTDRSFCMGQNTVVITGLSNARFFFHFLASEKMRWQFERATVGSSQSTLSLAAIRASLVVVPSPDEQSDIANRLDDLSFVLSKEESALRKYSLLKTGLMNDLLRGAVEVSA